MGKDLDDWAPTGPPPDAKVCQLQPYCHNPAPGPYRGCPLCRYKVAQRARKYRAKNNGDDYRAFDKVRKAKRKADHKCLNCGTQMPDRDDRVDCQRCIGLIHASRT